MWKSITAESISDQWCGLSTPSKVCAGVLGVYGGYTGAMCLYGVYRRTMNNRIRRTKQRQNEQSIGNLSKHVESDPLSADLVDYITNLDLTQLSQELKAGKIRPIEALRAYQTKALESHKKTNCLVEAITEAEEWALQLEKGPREGPLWGVPISIKDDVGIKGYDSTIGMVTKINMPAEEDCNILKVLRNSGAIPFVKTNVPQTCLSFEPGNPINGVVHNPHRHGYGPGASSSGEGALIASGGSLLGIGSDLGGSVRVPAHFCGIYGFKPTAERMSSQGMDLGPQMTIPIRATWGPLSRDLDGIVASIQALWSGRALTKADPECVPMGFDTEEFMNTRKLRVGFYVDNGIAPTFSACVRAVEEAKGIMAKLGHELVPWQLPDPDKNNDLLFSVLGADGGVILREELRYDVIDPTAKPLTDALFIPTWLKRLLSYILYPVDPHSAKELETSCGTGDVVSTYTLTDELWRYRQAVQRSWDQAGLDVVLCPPHIVAAPPLGNSELLMSTCIYTSAYNTLHFPAGVVPITRVLQDDVDQLQKDFPPGNRINDMARQAMSDSVDLPVGVMVVASKYNDETCLRAMKILDDGLKTKSILP